MRLWLHVTLPVGNEAVPPEVSTTVATQVTLDPTIPVEAQVTEVKVVRELTLTGELPELPECVASPP